MTAPSVPHVTVTAPSSPPITDLAAELMGQLNSGRAAARATLGDAGVAFAWAQANGPTLAPYCLSATVAGMQFTAVTIARSGTPADVVPPGGTKPVATVVTTAQKPLLKYAGMALVLIEDYLSAEGLIPALTNTILGQAYGAFDEDLVTAVVAAGHPVAGSGASGILAGIGDILAKGGHPTLAIMNPATLATAFDSMGNGWVSDPTQPIGSLFGLAVLLSPHVVDGQVVILDPTGVLVAQNEHSPMALVDPYHSADINTTRVLAEVVAGFAIASSDAIAIVTVTAGP